MNESLCLAAGSLSKEVHQAKSEQQVPKPTRVRKSRSTTQAVVVAQPTRTVARDPSFSLMLPAYSPYRNAPENDPKKKPTFWG